jgi:hypothetical protein
MSTYEALRFFGLDYYATALDIKAAYRQFVIALREAALDDATLTRDSAERLQMINRAYAALEKRVDHTPPDLDTLPGVAAAAMPAGLTAGQGARASWKLSSEWMQVTFLKLVQVLPSVGRAAAVFALMAGVGYGVVRGVAEKHFEPTVVAAKTVTAPRVEPMPMPAARVTAVEKTPAVREEKAPVVTVVPRSLRAPALPGVNRAEAEAIGSACLAETGGQADAFRTCVVRTAQETPHAIHLD